MTKKDAAYDLLGCALSMSGAMAGDEGVDEWVWRILYVARGLYPLIEQHPKYHEALFADESRETKLRRLIEHPETPTAEREAAVAALARIRSGR